MKTNLVILLFVLSFIGGLRAAEDFNSALQKGLFEEEGNQNLDAAVQVYQSLIVAHDNDRKVVATAIHRLGECYRKLGRTNDAVAQYRRILTDFSDQTVLVTLSRQNLAGLGAELPALAAGGVGSGPDSVLRQTAAALQADLARINGVNATIERTMQSNPGQVRSLLRTVHPDALFNQLLERASILETKRAGLRASLTDEHPTVVETDNQIKALDRRIAEEEKATIGLLKLKAEAMQRQLDVLKAGMGEKVQAGPGGSDSAGAAALQAPAAAVAGTDEEESEIRRIRTLIKNSPDLINAVTVQVGLLGDSVRLGTPLHKAAQQAQLLVARFLLENGAEVDLVDGFGRTPLSWAAGNGHRAMVELLLSRGANANTTVPTGINLNFHQAIAMRGFTPLHFAAKAGYRSVCEALLNGKADLATRTYSGETSLYLAVAQGFRATAELLLERGARVGDRVFGETPLHAAAGRGFLSGVELLIDKGSDVNARGDGQGATPLHRAVTAGNDAERICTLLLAKGANVNAQFEDGTTPLFIAVRENKPGVARLLLEKKADANIPSRSTALQGGTPWPPLVQAVTADQIGLVRLLLDHGAEAKAVNPDIAWILVYNAGVRGQAGILELLFAHGAEPNVQGKEGYTALILSISNNSSNLVGVVRAFLQAKADVNLAASDGSTPLYHAVARRQKEVVQLLLDAGAEVNIVTKNGQSPLSVLTPSVSSPFVGAFPQPQPLPAPGTPPGGARVIRNPNRSDPPDAPVDPSQEIVAMLQARGARADLRRLASISFSRNLENVTPLLFKGTNAWNQYTLMEVIGWICLRDDFAFPDLGHVTISRLDPKTAKTEDTQVNLQSLTDGKCPDDRPLVWGDIVDVPMMDHVLGAPWQGLSPQSYGALQRCLQRTVRLTINGTETSQILLPILARTSSSSFARNKWDNRMGNLRLRPWLRGTGLLLTSSDLTRVKLRRTDPITKAVQETVVNVTGEVSEQDDFWLRDGDVVEVPNK